MKAFERYVPAEKQVVGGETRYVRLADEPMPAYRVLPWLEGRGLVKREEAPECGDPDCGHEHCGDEVLVGWGTTYFGVPFDQAVER